MSDRARATVRLLLAIGLVVAVLAVGALATGVPGSFWSSTGPAPASSPSLAPAASSSAATSPPPSPSSSLDVAAEVGAVESQVPALRDLQPLRPVATRIVDPAQLRTMLVGEIDAAMPPATARAEEDALVRLGFARPGVDLRQLSLDSLSSQVLGMYDPASKSMTVVNRAGGFGLIARYTVAHEYTHALQDQHFDLQRLGIDATAPSDRVLALHALVEGDAMLASTLWLQRNMSLGDLADIGQLILASLQPVVPAGAPALLARETLFPYLEGMAFVQALYAQGGWAAVDAAYSRPPASSAEILHPDRYLAGWRPAAVAVPSLDAALGAGWRRTYADTFGEVGFQVWLAGVLGDAGARALAASWSGDQVVQWDGPAGAWVVAWRSSWATPAAARAIANATAALIPSLGPASETLSGTTVTLSVASDPSLLDRTQAPTP